jgi:Ca-activated chloride channel family protein
MIGPAIMAKRFGLVLALLLGVTESRADKPNLTFQSGVELINLNVCVVDGRNRYITDLAEADFTILEDGVRQQVSLFTRRRLDVSLVVMIDTSASMEAKLPVVRAAALRLVSALGPADTAEILQFNERASVLQPFTSDRAALEQAIAATNASGATSLYTALYVALKDLARERKTGELRRYAIALLSDGQDTASHVTDEQVLELARKNEVVIYSIRPRAGDAPSADGKAPGEADYFLSVLGRDTGGQAFFPASLGELNEVYDRIAEELRSEYSLGYVSSNVSRDGRWRRIGILTPGRAGLQVRHRPGYFAPRGQ